MVERTKNIHDDLEDLLRDETPVKQFPQQVEEKKKKKKKNKKKKKKTADAEPIQKQPQITPLRDILGKSL